MQAIEVEALITSYAFLDIKLVKAILIINSPPTFRLQKTLMGCMMTWRVKKWT